MPLAEMNCVTAVHRGMLRNRQSQASYAAPARLSEHFRGFVYDHRKWTVLQARLAGKWSLEEVIYDVQGADAALSELEVINKLSGAVEVGHRLTQLAKQHVWEARRLPLSASCTVCAAAAASHFMKRDSFELQRRRDVLDDVVGSAPVRPRLVETVEVAGCHECTDDVSCVGVRRSLRQQRRVSPDKCVQLLVTSWTSCTHTHTYCS